MTAELPSASAAPCAVDEENPWPGLESFRERDASFFRGRGAEVESLLQLVLRERLTILLGLSGLGKSSLLQAGLFPRLRDVGFLPVHLRLDHDEHAPPLAGQVLDRLADEAAARGVEAPEPLPGESLWEHLHRSGSAYWGPGNRPVVPVLAFDQFEEIFTLGRATPERSARSAAFLEELGDLIEGRAPEALRARVDAGLVEARGFTFNRHPYKVLVSLREDFLAELEGLREAIPSLGSNRMRLLPLSGDSALLVTGAGGGDLVPRGVGERIVRLVAGERESGHPAALSRLAVDPALLSLFCRELNDRRKALGRKSIGEELVEGGRNEILSDYYERSLGDQAPELRRFVEDRLLTVGGHRNSEALENALAQPGVSEEALNELVARRLLRREERDGGTRIELTHDVLTGIVRESRERREEEEREAEEREREAAEREKLRAVAAAARRRTRTFAGVALLLLLLSAATVVFGVAALRARREAERAYLAMKATALEDSTRACYLAQRLLSVRRAMLTDSLGRATLADAERIFSAGCEPTPIGGNREWEKGPRGTLVDGKEPALPGGD
jgi:hypothetical protein